jgi:hypothetical protein
LETTRNQEVPDPERAVQQIVPNLVVLEFYEAITTTILTFVPEREQLAKNAKVQ